MNRPCALRRFAWPIILLASLGLVGCSTAAREGAERGAKRGAIGGLVAGAVGSIFWGGDAVNNALRTAAAGAATGATLGALDGSERDRSPRKTGSPQGPGGDDAALRAWVGDGNYAAGEELARCRHASAIAQAERAFAAETDRDRKGFALLIQAMAAEESGNAARAEETYRRWARFDPARGDRGQARADALSGILRIQKIRQQQGLPVLCP